MFMVMIERLLRNEDYRVMEIHMGLSLFAFQHEFYTFPQCNSFEF